MDHCCCCCCCCCEYMCLCIHVCIHGCLCVCVCVCLSVCGCLCFVLITCSQKVNVCIPQSTFRWTVMVSCKKLSYWCTYCLKYGQSLPNHLVFRLLWNPATTRWEGKYMLYVTFLTWCFSPCWLNSYSQDQRFAVQNTLTLDLRMLFFMLQRSQSALLVFAKMEVHPLRACAAAIASARHCSQARTVQRVSYVLLATMTILRHNETSSLPSTTTHLILKSHTLWGVLLLENASCHLSWHVWLIL